MNKFQRFLFRHDWIPFWSAAIFWMVLAMIIFIQVALSWGH